MILATGGIRVADWVVVAVYFVGITAMGVYFARRQRSTREYFLGSRSMPSWVVGLSMIATLLSTISYLAVPGEMIKHGPGNLFAILGIPISFTIVTFLIIPFFMRLQITSAYEYLEVRFGSETRTLGALLFVVIRIVWMSVVVFTASQAMSKMTGIPLWCVILGVGLFTTFYAAAGGIRAVIWTDVIQFIILMGGAVFVAFYIVADMGMAKVASLAYQNTRLEAPIWSWDPGFRLTIIGINLHTVAWVVCTYGSDQTVVQRYLATRDAKAAARSYLVNCLGNLVLLIVLGAVGFALLAFYHDKSSALMQKFVVGLSGPAVERVDEAFAKEATPKRAVGPEASDKELDETAVKAAAERLQTATTETAVAGLGDDHVKRAAETLLADVIAKEALVDGWTDSGQRPAATTSGLSDGAGRRLYDDTIKKEADNLFPIFIATQLPMGLTGLIIAALFAAAMSSLDSGVNSVSAVITVDFYERRRAKKAADSTSLGFAKLLGLGLGLMATALGLFVDNIEGNIVEITNKSTSFVVAPLFGLFALGMFFRRTNQLGAIAGPIIGFLVGLVLTFSGQWFGKAYNVSFMWLIVVPVIVTLVAGYVISLFGPAPTAEQLRFTRRAVIRQDAGCHCSASSGRHC